MRSYSYLTRLRSITLRIVTFTYYGALHHYTIEPIEELKRDQANIQQVKKLLRQFKSQKREELEFVKKAAALAAGVVIGVFSWTSVGTSFWLAQLFWYSSLWFSVFALVSFSQQRMLDQIPDTNTEDNLCDDDDEEQLKVFLRFFLRPRHRLHKHDAEEGKNLSPLVLDWKLAWVWQTPMMLMSFSWLCFVLGYFLYFLTPLLAQSDGTTMDRQIGIAAIVVGGLVLLNFEANSILSHKAIMAVKKAGIREVTMSDSFASEMTVVGSNNTKEKTKDSAEKPEIPIKVTKTATL